MFADEDWDGDWMGGARDSGFSLNLEHFWKKINEKKTKSKKKNKVLRKKIK